MVLRFPALGAEKTIAMFPELAEPLEEGHGLTNEALEQRAAAVAVKLTVKLVGAGKAQEWGFRLAGIRQRDARRVVALREGTTKINAPELWGATITSEEGVREAETAYRAIIAESVTSVVGIVIGEGPDELDIAAVKDGKRLAAILGDLGLAGHAARRAISAQSPSEAQVFSRGS